MPTISQFEDNGLYCIILKLVPHAKTEESISFIDTEKVWPSSTCEQRG